MPALKRIANYLAVFGLEMSWSLAVLQLINPTSGYRLVPAELLAIMVLSFAIFKTLKRWVRPTWLVTIISWAFFWPLVTLSLIKIQFFGAVPLQDPVWLNSIPLAFSRIWTGLEPALLIIICSAVLWWMGRRLAIIKMDFAATVSEFQFGLIMLVFIYLIAHYVNTETNTAIPIILAFFTCGLLGISISHDQEGRGWFNSSGRWHWSVMLLISVGLILVIGLIVSLLLSPELLQMIIKGLKWLWETIEKLMQWLAGLFPQTAQPDETGQSQNVTGTPMPEETLKLHFPEWLGSSFRIIWTVMVAGLLLLAIWQMASQIFTWMRKNAGGTGGESESLKVNLWSDWMHWFKRLISGLLRIFSRDTGSQKSGITGEARRVRQIYGQWLRRMTSAGYPRQKARTPLEYQAKVEDLLCEQKEEVKAITSEYMRVRYGAAAPSIQEVERMKEQWNILKKAKIRLRAQDKNSRE